MPELITAIYHSKPICIFELLDRNGQYIEEIRSEYRRASQANELICPECQGVLELCAGAIVPPYFRHKSVSDCEAARELRTEAGKRSYYGKKMLYSLVKTAQEGEIQFDGEQKKLPYNPILLNINEKIQAFLYLDGESRNYEQLRKAQQIYEAQQITPYWFLHKRVQTNSRNITSNEAEVSVLNKGILYYLDTENQKMELRKAYESPYGERKYYTKSFSVEQLEIDANGEFNQVFEEKYKEYVERQRLELDRILRIPIEDGVEEVYFEFSYVYMDAIEEIWVLPPLQMLLEEQEYSARAKRNRELFLEQGNQAISKVRGRRRDQKAIELMTYVNGRRQASNWLN